MVQYDFRHIRTVFQARKNEWPKAQIAQLNFSTDILLEKMNYLKK